MNKEFDVHMLNEMGKSKASKIALAFDSCLETIKEICNEDQLSIVKLKLEEACFFAKKVMANDPINHLSKNQSSMISSPLCDDDEHDWGQSKKQCVRCGILADHFYLLKSIHGH